MNEKFSSSPSGRAILFRITEPFRQALGPAVIFLVLSYFVYHTLEGHHGLFALKDLKAREAVLEKRVAALALRRERLEGRVSLLRPSALDLDMLDEAARRKLAFVKDRDVVIPLDNRPIAVDPDGN